MAYTQNNIVLLDKKEAQSMCTLPVASAAGSTMIAPASGIKAYALWVTSATACYLYNHDDDGYSLIPSGALAGTFAAGTCGVAHPWSITYTANGGSTTTITVSTATHALTGTCIGNTVEFLTGANAGIRTVVTKFSISGTTATITFADTLTSVANGVTFRMTTGSFFVLNAYTALAANVFKRFDICTMTWQAGLATTNLPSSWGSAGQMVLPYTRLSVFAVGTATSGSATTLVNSAKTWTASQWIGYQVRITAGTGIGQIRVITNNDTTSLTFASGATIDDTSVYSIEGNEDIIYLFGNGAVTMYSYTISTNTWAAISPAVARSSAPTGVMMANWVGVTGNTAWADESVIQDGAYIYSPRGAATSTLHRYKISSNSWEAMTYNGTDTFTTGSSMQGYRDNLYIMQNATGKMFQYNISGNYMQGFFTDNYTQSTAVIGDKLWIKLLDTAGSVVWLYYILNTSSVVRRIMVY